MKTLFLLLLFLHLGWADTEEVPDNPLANWEQIFDQTANDGEPTTTSEDSTATTGSGSSSSSTTDNPLTLSQTSDVTFPQDSTTTGTTTTDPITGTGTGAEAPPRGYFTDVDEVMTGEAWEKCLLSIQECPKLKFEYIDPDDQTKKVVTYDLPGEITGIDYITGTFTCGYRIIDARDTDAEWWDVTINNPYCSQALQAEKLALMLPDHQIFGLNLSDYQNDIDSLDSDIGFSVWEKAHEVGLPISGADLISSSNTMNYTHFLTAAITQNDRYICGVNRNLEMVINQSGNCDSTDFVGGVSGSYFSNSMGIFGKIGADPLFGDFQNKVSTYADPLLKTLGLYLETTITMNDVYFDLLALLFFGGVGVYFLRNGRDLKEWDEKKERDNIFSLATILVASLVVFVPLGGNSVKIDSSDSKEKYYPINHFFYDTGESSSTLAQTAIQKIADHGRIIAEYFAHTIAVANAKYMAAAAGVNAKADLDFYLATATQNLLLAQKQTDFVKYQCYPKLVNRLSVAPETFLLSDLHLREVNPRRGDFDTYATPQLCRKLEQAASINLRFAESYLQQIEKTYSGFKDNDVQKKIEKIVENNLQIQKDIGYLGLVATFPITTFFVENSGLLLPKTESGSSSILQNYYFSNIRTEKMGTMTSALDSMLDVTFGYAVYNLAPGFSTIRGNLENVYKNNPVSKGAKGYLHKAQKWLSKVKNQPLLGALASLATDGFDQAAYIFSYVTAAALYDWILQSAKMVIFSGLAIIQQMVYFFKLIFIYFLVPAFVLIAFLSKESLDRKLSLIGQKSIYFLVYPSLLTMIISMTYFIDRIFTYLGEFLSGLIIMGLENVLAIADTSVLSFSAFTANAETSILQASFHLLFLMTSIYFIFRLLLLGPSAVFEMFGLENAETSSEKQLQNELMRDTKGRV